MACLVRRTPADLETRTMSFTLPPIAPGHEFGAGPAPAAPAAWDTSHVGFGDVLEALNPLQYVPGVGTIYREATGDSVHPALRIAVAGAASFLLGGPIGLAAAMIGAVVGEIAGGGSPSPTTYAQADQAYRRLAREA
jgi:hypothetical protein